MKQKGSLLWGVFLILIGLVFLLGNVSRLGMESLWPIFPFVVGIAFWVGFINDRKNFGLLMPGSILIVISLLFFYCNFWGWWRMETAWPVFLLAPATGFFAMYFAGNRDQGLLIPGGILAGLALIFLFISSGLRDFWPLLLIAAGILIIFMQFRSSRTEEDAGAE